MKILIFLQSWWEKYLRDNSRIKNNGRFYRSDTELNFQIEALKLAYYLTWLWYPCSPSAMDLSRMIEPRDLALIVNNLYRSFASRMQMQSNMKYVKNFDQFFEKDGYFLKTSYLKVCNLSK